MARSGVVDHARLADLHAAGANAVRMAAALQVTQASIYRALLRLGLTLGQRRIWTDDEVRRLEAMRRNSVPVHEIAAALGRDEWQVQYKLKKLGMRAYVKRPRASNVTIGPPIADDPSDDHARACDAVACDQLLALLRQHHPGAV